jgi:hypothetical protein
VFRQARTDVGLSVGVLGLQAAAFGFGPGHVADVAEACCEGWRQAAPAATALLELLENGRGCRVNGRGVIRVQLGHVEVFARGPLLPTRGFERILDAHQGTKRCRNGTQRGGSQQQHVWRQAFAIRSDGRLEDAEGVQPFGVRVREHTAQPAVREKLHVRVQRQQV